MALLQLSEAKGRTFDVEQQRLAIFGFGHGFVEVCSGARTVRFLDRTKKTPAVPNEVVSGCNGGQP